MSMVETTSDTAVPARPNHFGSELATKMNGFAAALPKHIPQERFARVVMTAVQRNPDLLGADRQSLWNSSMQAAADGLLPDGREGALVVYNTKEKRDGKDVWIKKVQWLPMIAGIRKKVRNSGEIVDWTAQVVHANDAFEYELGDDPFIKHKPLLHGDRGPVIAAYSVATLKGGEKSREVMTIAELQKVKAASKSPETGPWKGWFEEMCRKTVAKRHAKVLPMSTDLDDLLRRDDELYDLKGASDRVAGSTHLSLAGKLDALAEGPRRGGTTLDQPRGQALPTDVDQLPAHDPATGEIIEQLGADAAGDEDQAGGPSLSPAGGERAAPVQQRPDEAGQGQPAPAADDRADPRKAALVQKLRAKAEKGTNALRLALGGLVPAQNELLGSEDHDALGDMAEAADRQGGRHDTR